MIELAFYRTQQQADWFKQLNKYLALAPTHHINPALFWKSHSHE
jgi:hypothetical protein